LAAPVHRKFQIDAEITDQKKRSSFKQTGYLVLDEKHFRFEFFTVAYKNVHEIAWQKRNKGWRTEYFLVVEDTLRRYRFGPFSQPINLPVEVEKPQSQPVSRAMVVALVILITLLMLTIAL